MDFNELREKLYELFSNNEKSDISVGSFEFAGLHYLAGGENGVFSKVFGQDPVFYAVKSSDKWTIFPVKKKYNEELCNFAEENDIDVGKIDSSSFWIPIPYIKGDKVKTLWGLRDHSIYLEEMASYRNTG